MTPHLNEEQIAAYGKRSLGAAKLLEAAQHIAECETCRDRVASHITLHAGIEAFRVALKAEPAHLTYHEIASYVDRQTAGEDREEIEKHLRDCRSCSAEVEEIEAVRCEMEAPRNAPGWLAWIAGFWRKPLAWKGAFALVGAAACAAVMFLVVPKRAPEVPKQAVVKRAEPARQEVASLETLPASLRPALSLAIASRQIEPPAVLADLSGKRGVLLGSPTTKTEVDLIDPVGIVVETPTPTLRWKPITGAGAEYQASIYNEHFAEVATSEWIRGAEWQVPRALERGARYSWQLNVRLNGTQFTVPRPPAPETRFRILDSEGEAEIAQLRTANSPLLLGIGYAQLGALEEAEQQLRLAETQNPDAAAVSALLASVERLRNRQP